MPEGYIKLWRKSLDSPVWDNPKVWRFWTWCLMKASHKDIDIMVGYQNITLQPGQFVFGLNNASLETKLSIQSIRTCLSILKNDDSITVKSTNKYSVISIVKWQDYQDNSTNKATNNSTNQQTNNKQITNKITNKNDMTYTQNDGVLLNNQQTNISMLDGKSTTNKKNKNNNNKEIYKEIYKEKVNEDEDLDNHFKKFVEIYEDKFKKIINNTDAELLQELSDEFPVKWFEEAVDKALENGANNLKYVSKILYGKVDNKNNGHKQFDKPQEKPQPTIKDVGEDYLKYLEKQKQHGNKNA
jgi:hypothetical protein